MMSMLETLFLFYQTESELEVEDLQKPKTLDQFQASTFKEPDENEARNLNPSSCDIL